MIKFIKFKAIDNYQHQIVQKCSYLFGVEK